MYNIVFYETPGGRVPVQDFLDDRCTNRQRARTLSALSLLEEAGFQLGPPWLRKLSRDLWEVRVEADKVHVRIIFGKHERTFVLLHALRKQTQKLPAKDLEMARARWREYRSRVR